MDSKNIHIVGLDNIRSRFHWSGDTKNEDSDCEERMADYFSRFYLAERDFKAEWAEKLRDVFDLSAFWPDMIFRREFSFYLMLGGCAFEEKDYNQLTRFASTIGEVDFAMIEDWRYDDRDRARLNFKFPTSTSWETITNACNLSDTVTSNVWDHYFVLGSSSSWGMYCGSDLRDPVNVLGFDPKHSELVRSIFDLQEGQYFEDLSYIPEDERSTWDHVPTIYRR